MPLVLDGNGDITGLVAGALPSNVIGTGAVLQVVQATATTEVVVNNTTTFSSLGLSASITPISTSSRILVLLSVATLTTTSAPIVAVKIQRNGSDIQTFGFVAHFNASTSVANYGNITYLDSPNSTSSLTYSVLGNSNQGQSYFQYDDGAGDQISTITLMEIA